MNRSYVYVLSNSIWRLAAGAAACAAHGFWWHTQL